MLHSQHILRFLHWLLGYNLLKPSKRRLSIILSGTARCLERAAYRLTFVQERFLTTFVWYWQDIETINTAAQRKQGDVATAAYNKAAADLKAFKSAI